MGDVIKSVEKFRKGWKGGLPETPCGSGSMLKNTEAQREWIPQIITRYQIADIVDIGAGDLNWMNRMPMPAGVQYTAYDLVPRHSSVQKFDLVREVPPQADMIMCLWVLNHLPYDDCQLAIENIKASGSHYLMMTDRPKWHCEQPVEILMSPIEQLILNDKGDNIMLVEL